MQEILKVAAAAVVVLASFSLGLQAPRFQRSYVREHRALLLRSLLAILVVVPIATVLFAKMFRLPDATKAGLAFSIIAVGIGPLAALSRMKATDPRACYALVLNVGVMILSVAFVPLAYRLYGVLTDTPLRIQPMQVAELVVTRALLPLGLGMAVAAVFPRVCAPAAKWSSLLVNVATGLIAAVALIASWKLLRDVGGATWLACAGVACGAVAIGHLMGGPDRETRGVRPPPARCGSPCSRCCSPRMGTTQRR